MDENITMKKISSKYIIQIILSYIKDKNWIYNLFIYSKYYQKELNFQKIDYKELYYEKRIHYEDYLSIFFYDDKSELENQFKRNISQYEVDEEEIKKISINYFKKYLKNNNRESFIFEFDKEIDIFSPFFDILSEIDFFGEIFSILINTKYISKFNLKNFYISKFNKLNKSNSKYSSIIFNFGYNKDISFLKDLKINFNYVKKLLRYF